jgi:hypothetical protein
VNARFNIGDKVRVIAKGAVGHAYKEFGVVESILANEPSVVVRFSILDADEPGIPFFTKELEYFKKRRITRSRRPASKICVCETEDIS